ncbi:MAG: hypothetical protein IPH46_09505 [Bacteroidetes bacterium]|nr:hypothetical protein [Bacteroidota bacterium]
MTPLEVNRIMEKKSSSSVINALKRFEEFNDTQPKYTTTQDNNPLSKFTDRELLELIYDKVK